MPDHDGIRRATAVLERDWKLLALTVLMGVGLHFLFDWWPSILTEFIAPVSESIWEHGKLTFWPLLLVFSLRGRGKGATRWLLAAVLSTLALLLAGWTYHVALGGTALWVDLALYVLSIALGFLLAELLPLEEDALPFAIGAAVVFAALLIAFTVNPPSGTLFNDPARADAWVNLPC